MWHSSGLVPWSPSFHLVYEHSHKSELVRSYDYDVDDFEWCLENCTANLYADDTSVTTFAEDMENSATICKMN